MHISAVFFLTVSLLAAQVVTPPRISVTSSAQAEKLIEAVPPVYPKLALQARIQGVVRFEVVIASDGAVKEARLISGHPLMAEDALDAVRAYKYRPTLLNGRAVEVATTVEVNFSLQGGPYATDPLDLFQQGEALTAADAAQLQTAPNNKAARAQLLGYYTAHKQILERRETLVWFLQNDPTSTLNLQGLSMAPGNSLADPDGYQLLKNLWLNHPRLNSENSIVLQRAGSFFESFDKPEAERIYRMIPRGGEQVLGPFYVRAILGGSNDSNQPAIDAAEASKLFAEHARTILASTTSAAMAMAALPGLRQAAGSSGKYQDLIEHLQSLVPVRATPVRINEK